eukprot:CFRG7678T1
MLFNVRAAVAAQSRSRVFARHLTTSTRQSGQATNTLRNAAVAMMAGMSAAGLFYSQNEPSMNAKEMSERKIDMSYKYVIVGAGVAAKSCLKTINELLPQLASDGARKERRYDGKVLMVGNDPRQNSLGYTDKNHDELINSSNDPENNILQGHEAVSLNVQEKTITLSDGTVVSFDKVFLATGGHYPTLRNVRPEAMERVTTFRSVSDLENIVKNIESGKITHVSVIGGGALGTEIALALRDKSPAVSIAQIYAEPGILHRNMPEYFRAYCTALARSKGIEQKNFSLVSDISVNPSDHKLNVTIDSWEQSHVVTDHVIFAPTHIDANSDLAADAGLEIDLNNSGIMVNAEMSAFSDVYVGGDSASYPNPYLGRRRDQNYDHAVTTGKIAATNMLGGRESYDHVPISRINLGILGLDNTMVGSCDSTLDTIGFWQMSKTKKKGKKTDDQYFFTSRYHKGATFYLDNGVVVGIMLTNLEDPDDVKRAQVVIEERVEYGDLGRQELESELKDKLGFELQLPMTRFTQNRQPKISKVQKNKHKTKRHETELIARHSTDVIKDANTNLYWRSN